jgi:hypothetical protein
LIGRFICGDCYFGIKITKNYVFILKNGMKNLLNFDMAEGKFYKAVQGIRFLANFKCIGERYLST